MNLSSLIALKDHPTLAKDYVASFGDTSDGVIEIPALTHDNEIIEVGYYYGTETHPNKNIIGISPEAGCPVRCAFCELGEEKFKRDLTAQEMYDQVVLMLKVAAQSGVDIDHIQHKVSFAKTGEPLFNKNLVEALEMIEQFGFSFKISTVFPHSPRVYDHFKKVAEFAARYRQAVQIQISLISTSEEYRRQIAGIKVASFEKIRELSEYWYTQNEGNPHRRKINASLIIAEDTPCDPNAIKQVLPPQLVNFRFRPCVVTENASQHHLTMVQKRTLMEIKKMFRNEGYEVGDAATPTPTEMKFGLVSNVTRRRYIQMTRSG